MPGPFPAQDLTVAYDAILPFGAAAFNAMGGSFYPLAASGALNPNQSGTYFITDAGVAALTLAAPQVSVAGAVPGNALQGTPGSDGVVVRLISTTAFAHTLTATGLLNTGTASVNVATFAAHPGAQLTLLAYQGEWYVLSAVGITFS